MFIVTIIVGNISKGNGTERAVTNLANSLCNYGDYKVHIISCSSDKTENPYFNLHNTIEIHHLGILLSSKFNYIKLQKNIKRVCEETKTDYLLGTTHALNSIMAVIKVKGLKKVACEHMNYAAAPLYSRIARRLAYPRLNAIVLLTESDRKHYSFCKNTYVIPNSVPEQNMSSNCENKIILAIGRYTKQKGFDMLIKAFALAHSQIPDWFLRIVGDGEDKNLLETLIHENDLDNYVELVPPTKEIEKEYLNAGLFVLSSRWEGFVLVLIEAKSYGLPSVAFNCPEGPSDILQDGKDGYLVSPENIEEFSKKLVELANDEKKRKAFGTTAKKDIKRLNPESIFNQWDSLFKDLL